MGAEIPHSRPWITKADRLAVEQTLCSGQLAHGQATEVFEKEFADYLGSQHAVSCASGTVGFIIALKALGVGPGDAVIVPTYVCQSILAAVRNTGASPQICDVNENGVLTRDTLAAHVNENTAAILAVHILGRQCDVESLQSFGVPVIEDVCQSFGLTIGGRAAGTLGTMAFFSFHATKCLTTGEGGMVVCNDAGLAQRVRAERDGMFSFMSDMQAALGSAQLSRYSEFLERRRQLWQRFIAVEKEAGIEIDRANENFPFRLIVRNDAPFAELRRAFLAHGVHVRKGVDQMLHRVVGLDDKLFPNAVKVFENTVSVPFYPALKNGEAGQVVQAMKRVFDAA